MPILSFSPCRAIASWLIWLLVVVLLLVPQSSPAQVPVVDLWQSPSDPVGWLGPRLRYGWYLLGWHVRRWLGRWEGRLVLIMRVWACRNLAEVIQVLTRRQVVRYLGALPVLLALLERLKVRQIINRHCPTHSPVDHGAVALVLVLNRLMAPRPLYKIVDWLATTWISEQLGIPEDKFNDDRLGRTLDVLSAHLPAIWSEIQQQTLLSYRIDLSILFYDLTALIMTGQYPESALVDYGFAHNTPIDDPKLKLGLTASRDGGIPLCFRPWCGRTADKATVQSNMEHLRGFLQQHGWSTSQVLVVGDCANLSSELALAYEDAHLRYLASLARLETVHRQLVLAPAPGDFARLPLAADYGGVPCMVPFTHNGRTLTHRGLVVCSEPMRQQLRQERRQQLRALLTTLHQIQAKIGQKRYRSEKEITQRVATQVKRSPVGALVGVQVATIDRQVRLDWWIDANALQAAERTDGRFLLVTNDDHLAYPQMLALYRQKDALEKRFEVAKQDLQVRPLYVHSDERIQAMLLVNLIALLAYSLLERQAEQHGLHRTTRRILDQLATLQLQKIEAWDGSCTCSWQETRPGQAQLLWACWLALDEPPDAGLPTGPLTRHLLPPGVPGPLDPPPPIPPA
jgi:transposase